MNGGFIAHRRIPNIAATAIVAVVAFLASAARTSAADDTRAIVWVLDGAGDLRGCSTALTKTFADNPWVELRQFYWSHGYRRLIADQIDYAHARRQGERLAELVQADAKSGRRSVIVAHSA